MFAVPCLAAISFATVTLSLRADDSAKQASAATSPEHTVLLLWAPITESSLRYAGYHVSSVDRPWWSKVHVDIQEDVLVRMGKEYDASPARFSTGIVYECQAKWIVRGEHPFSHRTLKVTSPPRRLQIEGRQLDVCQDHRQQAEPPAWPLGWQT